MRHARFGLLLAGLGALGLAAWAPGCLFAPDDCTDLLKCPGIGGGGSSSTVATGSVSSAGGGTTSTTATTTTSVSTGPVSCTDNDDCKTVPGSCMKKVCKSSLCEDEVDTTNIPTDDGNPCTQEACTPQGVPHAGVPTGAPCEGKAGVCDSMGTCVGCLKAIDCIGVLASCDLTTHTCFSCSDGTKNGTETGIDCGGNCPSCKSELCGSAGACASGKCVDSVCCDTDCTDTCKACNLPGSLGTCSSTPIGQTDATCNGLKACDGSSAIDACKTAPGLACPSDDLCASGVCFGGLCRVQNNGTCTDDIACGSGLCSNSGSGLVCTACNAGNQCKSSMCVASTCKAPGGAPCEASSDCAGGLCQNNFCMLNNNATCAVNEDCKSGYCNGGTCKPCGSNNDCPVATACGNAYFGPNVCERPSSAYCFTDTQCAAASGGKCVGFPAKCL